MFRQFLTNLASGASARQLLALQNLGTLGMQMDMHRLTYTNNAGPAQINCKSTEGSLSEAEGQQGTLVRWGLPSKLTKVALFSVYAEPGRMMSALSAPLSPWWP